MAASPPNQNPTRSQNPSLQTLLAADFDHSKYCLPTWDGIDNPYNGFNETRSHEQGLLETSFTALSLSDPCCGSHFSANDNTSSIDSIPWRSSNEFERENGLPPPYYTEEQQHLHTMRIQSAVRGHTGNWLHDLPSWQTNYRDIARQSSSSSSSSSTSLGQSFGAEMNYQYASSNPIIGNDLQWGSYEQKMFRSTIRPSSNRNGIRPEELKGPLICSLHKLMVHPYGENYVQKLFQQNNREITRYLHAMNCDEQMLFNICTHHQGSRSMQKFLSLLRTPKQKSLIISALRKITFRLTKVKDGCHVIKHCLQIFSYVEDMKHILNEIAERCVDIARDKSGCCLFQQCITYDVGEATERIVAEIVANAFLLSEDAFGNYVVQYLLFGLRKPSITRKILAQFEGKFVALSLNKFGSHVVQKCLQELGEECSNRIIMELTCSPNVFLNVAQDNFGNFIIQGALAVSKGAIHERLVSLINNHSQLLKSHLHGAWITRFYKNRQNNNYRWCSMRN
ncbi:putative pumilio homolog 8, chloroplastic isoform X1 [Quercus lobata]|uniref:PUM-HD domain-containing protein n=1 Tax=Quercus lobata TaxID=97700 RepID=A0A7N2RDE4_QUELO|nr:putative pumilio homolog 8, chloroplastic isoform X1 [Quercus lobata]